MQGTGIKIFLPGELEIECITAFLRRSFDQFPAEVGNLDFKTWPLKLQKFSYCIGVEGECGGLLAALFVYLNDMETLTGFIPFICALRESCKGIAYFLHEKCLALAKAKGFTVLRLEVIRSNRHAYNFYVRNGYSIVSVDEDRNRLLMERSA